MRGFEDHQYRSAPETAARAKNGKEMNPELGAFVTGDGELLARKEELSRIIRIPILSPSEYRKGLGLKTY